MIKIKDFVIQYGDHIVVERSSFVADAGKLYVISGKSGCGKSSILQLIGLLDQFTYQSYQLGQYNVEKLSKDEINNIRKKNIGLIFQEKNFFDELSIYDNLKLQSYISGTSISEEKVQKLLDKVKLSVSLKQKVFTLSGGEKQRLALACILCKDPEIILADEPTSGLDDYNASILMDTLKELAHQDHKCVIIVSHNAYVQNRADVNYRIEDQKLIGEENHSNNDLNLKKHRLPFSFYHTYIANSSLVKSKLYTLMLILIALCISVVTITDNLKNEMIYQNDQLNQNSIISDIRLHNEDSFSQKDLDYYRDFQYVEEVNYFYMIQEGDFYYYSAYKYEKIKFNSSDEVYINECMSGSGYEIGDVIYCGTLKKEFTVAGIVDQELDGLSKSNHCNIYVDSSNFENEVPYDLLLHIDSYKHIDSVIHEINDLELPVVVSTGSNTYRVLSDLQSNMVEILNKASITLLSIMLLIIIYIQYIDIQSHIYEIALMKANGLSNREVNLLFVYRTLLHELAVLGIGMILLLIANLICIQFNLSTITIGSGYLFLIGLSMSMLFPMVIVMIKGYTIKISILLRN